MSEAPARLRWQLLASHVPADGRGGGMIRYVVELASALDRRADVELSVLAAAEAVPFFRGLLSEPDRVQGLPRLPAVGEAMFERYTRRADRGGPFDVVHGTKHLVPRRSRAKRVLTVHDMVLFDRPRDFGLAKRNLLGRPYLASVRDADLKICVSAATRARMIEAAPGNRGPSAVVPLAVASSLLAAHPVPVPELDGRQFALVVGDSSPRKNLGLIVDAWARVRKAAPEAVLAVVGPPSWTASETGESFARLSAGGALSALGHVDDAALRWCYENAAVALCPSRLEGFGLPAIEAMAFGTPLITSTDPALCEVSGTAADHLSPDRPDQWVEHIVRALGAPRHKQTRPVPRSWDAVADETVSAVRSLP